MDQLRQSEGMAVGAKPCRSAFPCVGRFLLCVVGHLPFDQGLTSRIYGIFSYAILPLALSVLLLSVMALAPPESESLWHIAMVFTLCLLQLGVSFASWSLKSNKLECVLGPKDQQLDEYAEERGYMADWQKLSKRRFWALVSQHCLLSSILCIPVNRDSIYKLFFLGGGGVRCGITNKVSLRRCLSSRSWVCSERW